MQILLILLIIFLLFLLWKQNKTLKEYVKKIKSNERSLKQQSLCHNNNNLQFKQEKNKEIKPRNVISQFQTQKIIVDFAQKWEEII